MDGTANEILQWLEKVDTSGQDASQLLDEAPPAVQQLREAWADKNLSLQTRAASAISFLEGWWGAAI